MSWMFDQAPGVACITCRSVIDGQPVLFVAHDEEDHSWVFTDGGPADPASALVVAMSEVVLRHPDLVEIAGLPPGWSAARPAAGQPWRTRRDEIREA